VLSSCDLVQFNTDTLQLDDKPTQADLQDPELTPSGIAVEGDIPYSHQHLLYMFFPGLLISPAS
jgi:hypothetical protein